ncbi:MAG: hypothetical protein MH825_13190 [Cyanobacteria bacterium]|nr:hypothetical protein [Cyanobacteriota bacterium]
MKFNVFKALPIIWGRMLVVVGGIAVGYWVPFAQAPEGVYGTVETPQEAIALFGAMTAFGTLLGIAAIFIGHQLLMRGLNLLWSRWRVPFTSESLWEALFGWLALWGSLALAMLPWIALFGGQDDEVAGVAGAFALLMWIPLWHLLYFLEMIVRFRSQPQQPPDDRIKAKSHHKRIDYQQKPDKKH